MRTTATKERPILFSSPMVRAILSGAKTQTRRVAKLPKWADQSEPMERERIKDTPDALLAICRSTGCFAEVPCRFQRAMRLWVRETWAYFGGDEYMYQREPSQVVYAADFQDDHRSREWSVKRWKPSIHMPRWASRITLEITSVRVERLQAITEADAVAEGCTIKPPAVAHVTHPIKGPLEIPWTNGTAKEEFVCLWNTINGPGSWDTNPWVWALTFKVVT